MWYTVRDNITGEIMDYSDKSEAQMEAERRVDLHKQIHNKNAVIIKNGRNIIICNQSEL